MSGRLHVFLPPEARSNLEEMTNHFQLTQNQHAESHVFQCAIERLIGFWKENQLTGEQLQQLSDVPDQVSTASLPLFLKQSNIDRMFSLADKLGTSTNDFALGHIAQTGFSWLYCDWKAAKLPQDLLDKLASVITPKVVYHF